MRIVWAGAGSEGFRREDAVEGEAGALANV